MSSSVSFAVQKMMGMWAVSRRSLSRRADDGDVGRLAPLLEQAGHAESAHLAHHHVEQQQGVALHAPFEGLFGAVGHVHVVAFLFQVELQYLAEGLFVVDDQYSRFRHKHAYDDFEAKLRRIRCIRGRK